MSGTGSILTGYLVDAVLALGDSVANYGEASYNVLLRFAVVGSVKMTSTVCGLQCIPVTNLVRVYYLNSLLLTRELMSMF